MRELKKNYVYDLSELTSEEWDLLKPILNKNSISKFKYKTLEDNFRDGYRHIYFNLTSDWVLIHKDDTKNYSNIVNAKELFYTLENVQVDCRYLTRKKIKEMTDVFEKNGYEKWMDSDALKIQDNFTYLRIGMRNDFYINGESDNKTTITYEKFMELFGIEKSNFKKLVEVLNEELTEEAYKETANKLNYELDFNFITQLAERMAQNKHKYEPYNWQRLDNIEDLKQALYRHVMEVMKGNYEDDNRLFGHLESIALNAMFINYQFKSYIQC